MYMDDVLSALLCDVIYLLTRSFLFQVPSSSCVEHQSNCHHKTAYEPASSSTYAEVVSGAKSVFNIEYGSGAVSGQFVTDTVSVKNMLSRV
jgi:hypothetical protein